MTHVGKNVGTDRKRQANCRKLAELIMNGITVPAPPASQPVNVVLIFVQAFQFAASIGNQNTYKFPRKIYYEHVAKGWRSQETLGKYRKLQERYAKVGKCRKMQERLDKVGEGMKTSRRRQENKQEGTQVGTCRKMQEKARHFEPP